MNKDKPKVLCISALPPPYHGTSVANDILLNSKLIRSSFNINIIQLKKSKLQLGGKFSLATLWADFLITLKVLKEIITFRPQLTYVGIAQSKIGLCRDLGWVWMATFGGSKCLSHMHGGYFRTLFDYDLDDLTRWFARKTLSRLGGIIVLDSSLIYLFKGLVADERIFVLRNGIPNPFNDLQIAAVSEQRASSQQIRVTFLSNLMHGKGFDTFLEVAAMLKERGQGKDFLFFLAGAPPTSAIEAQVRKFVRLKGLEKSVKILGYVESREKNGLLLHSDVFVFPSRLTEGQPLVIIESLAAALPVIATPGGGIGALVQEGVNGFIVPEDDPATIADRLQLLRNDPSRRLSLGAASRTLFLKNYTEDKFIRGFATILQRVIGQP
jgi:glycosyltransferase involved in cell wall biosynthesis